MNFYSNDHIKVALEIKNLISKLSSLSVDAKDKVSIVTSSLENITMSIKEIEKLDLELTAKIYKEKEKKIYLKISG